jgi:uncharacterized protein (UPF0332 family)
MTTPTKEAEIRQFMIRAQEMLAASEDTLRLGHYSTAVNRSYYAIFYAASALLRAVDEKRSKHHGVLSAFRQYFIKPGLWPNEFSRIYGRVLEERESGDYKVFTSISREDAAADLEDARRFVSKAESWLKEEGLL